MIRLRGLRPVLGWTLLAVIVLAGCTEEETGPQFVSDPRPSRAPTEVGSAASPSPVAAATPIPMATPSSIGDLLRVRGAISQVFVSSNNTLWSIPGTGEARQVLKAPSGSRIVAFDPAPGADQVAVLLEESASGSTTWELMIVDGSGQILNRMADFGVGQATPDAGAGAGASANVVDWSPQGDRVLVVLRDGSMFEVLPTDDGVPAELKFDSGGGEVVSPSWSPTGEAIAFIAASGDNRERSLRVFEASNGELATAVNSQNGRFVVDYMWMPDGVSLLFTEGGEVGGAVSGIDLWRVGANGENRELLVSAGTVAPVARITTMRPSPDGRSVAYAVLVPGSGTPRVDSVWVRDIASGIGYRIPLPTVASVEDIWWTNQGLVIFVTTAGSGRERSPMLALLQVKQDGTAEALWATPLASSSPEVGTPVATPVMP